MNTSNIIYIALGIVGLIFLFIFLSFFSSFILSIYVSSIKILLFESFLDSFYLLRNYYTTNFPFCKVFFKIFFFFWHFAIDKVPNVCYNSDTENQKRKIFGIFLLLLLLIRPNPRFLFRKRNFTEIRDFWRLL